MNGGGGEGKVVCLDFSICCTAPGVKSGPCWLSYPIFTMSTILGEVEILHIFLIFGGPINSNL